MGRADSEQAAVFCVENTLCLRVIEDEVLFLMKTEVAAEVKAMPINSGLEEKDRREIAESLSRMMADTYTLYLKTHNFH